MRLVGSWTSRSGNHVDVFVFFANGPALGAVECEWDQWPLATEDQADWTERIRPAVLARVAELLERPGPRGGDPRVATTATAMLAQEVGP